MRRWAWLIGATAWIATWSTACSRSSPPGGDPPSVHASANPRSPQAAQPAAPLRDPAEPTRAAAGAPPGTAAHPDQRARELTWRFEQTPVGPLNVVISVPAYRAGQPPLPVLIAMHGRGEALRGPERGARGWLDDYHLGRVVQRLEQPPLQRRDFLDFVESSRLAQLNASLSTTPYRGLIVVCPYTPESLAGSGGFDAAPPFADFLLNDVLARVRRELPASPEPRHTGIDGVSLGGRGSLLVGLARPAAFGAVGTLQPAFDDEEVPDLAQRARAAIAANPNLKLRLLTSDGDYFLEPTRAIARAFAAARVPHQLTTVVGPHDYPFNRGPGAIEMLLFHDRVLRGQAAP